MTQLPPSTCARQFVARPFVGGALPDLVQWGGPWATSPAVHSDGALEVFMGTASSHGGHLSPVWEEVRQNALTLCKANEFVLAYLHDPRLVRLVLEVQAEDRGVGRSCPPRSPS